MSSDLPKLIHSNRIIPKLKNPIANFTNEELNVLYKAFDVDSNNNDSLRKVDDKISKLTLTAGGFLQEGIKYSELIDYLATKKGINLKENFKAKREKELFLKLFQQGYERKTDQEKKEFQEQLIKKGMSPAEASSVASLSTIAVAQLSGFGVYMLASSTVSAVAGFFGATLSFGFYTTMSSVISYAIGPVGIILASIPLYKTFKDVKSLEEAWGKVKNMGSGFKKIITGDTENALRIFEYIAAVRLMKFGEYELQKTEVINRIKQTEKNQIIQISVVNEKMRLVTEKNRELDVQKRIVNRLEREKEVRVNAYEIEKNKEFSHREEIKSSQLEIIDLDKSMISLANQIV